MRLLELALLKFGPFSEVHLDFTPDDKQFHVIFGLNEAGKSSALRAVSGLLFGIPESTRDDHLYRKTDLRIGASLENRQGERVHVVRRKGRKNTLLDPGESIIDEGVLTACLGGVGRELFHAMFGLSHEALIQGGEDLLRGKGELGESLFAAAMGISGIHTLRTNLWEEADGIFTPGAQKRPLNRALNAFQEAKKRGTQLSLKPGKWQGLQNSLQEAIGQLEGKEGERQQSLAELNRLERLQRVLAPVLKRNELLMEKERLGEVPLVPESCTEQRTGAQRTLREGEVREKKLLDEKSRCEEQKAGLHVPEELLSREAAVEDMRERIGAHKKAMLDLSPLKHRMESSSQDACRILRELARGESLEDVDRLRVDAASQVRIRSLGKTGARLETELENKRKAVTSVEASIRQAERDRSELPPVRDGSGLRRAVDAARKRGDLEDQLRKLDIELATRKDEAETRLAALGQWRGTIDLVEKLPLPTVETIDRFRARLEDLTGDRRLAEKAKADGSRQIKEISAQLTALEEGRSVATEDELQEARVERDESWQRIRAAWLHGEQPDGTTPDALASEYEREVLRADEVADRLWHDAERVAKHAALTAERIRCETECEECDRRLEELAEQEAMIGSEWGALWKPADIDPLPPVEMRSWLGRHEKLATSVSEWKKHQTEREALIREIGDHRDRCGRELVALGESAAAHDALLGAVLDRAEEVLEHLDDIKRMRGQVERDLEKAEAQRKEDQAELERCNAALDGWREEWRSALAALGLGATAGTDEAEAILNGLSRLFEKVDAIESDRQRVRHIEDDVSQFAEEVVSLARECAPDLGGLPPEQAAAEIVNRFKSGKDNLKDRKNLDKRLRALHEELDDLKRDHEGAWAVLNSLMEKVGATTPEELEAAERRSQEYRTIVSTVEDLDEQLLREGVAIEEIVEQAKVADPDALAAEIPKHTEEVESIGKECAELQEKIGSLKTDLRAMDGSQAAADAASEAQEALAEIKEHVDKHARLKLAALLLDRAIESYSERSQGPILRRAGEMFSGVTLGAFTGLTTGFVDGDRLALACVRDTGEKVTVEGLSDGTRDQLYLALRLASLERHLAATEPLPLILDDILIRFDDRRARATLELLSEVSEKTQVLFFTHHARLVDLAREAIPGDRLNELDLDRLSSSRGSS